MPRLLGFGAASRQWFSAWAQGTVKNQVSKRHGEHGVGAFSHGGEGLGVSSRKLLSHKRLAGMGAAAVTPSRGSTRKHGVRNMSTVPKGRVLIADDEEFFILATSDLLRSEGFECDGVQDAEHALSLLEIHQYDVLISDIRMPGNPNLELIQRLPEVAQGLPVILVTGYPSMHSAIQSVRLPVVAYLVKPVDAQELLAHVRAHAANAQAYRIIRGAQSRLKDCYEDLGKIETVMRHPVDHDSAAPIDAFLTLTLRNVVDSLGELHRLVESVIHAHGDPTTETFPNYPHRNHLLAALEETIMVLEKTKSAFKSKDLGELRRKLEGLVKADLACYNNRRANRGENDG